MRTDPATPARPGLLTQPFTISGTGMYVPDRVVTNAEVGEPLGVDDAWIQARTGIIERRRVAAGEATTAMAAKAAQGALDDASLSVDDIDLLILATTTPDQPIPQTSPAVVEALGGRCGAFDLNGACAGFVYAVITASAMVGAGMRHVLVVAAETLSSITDPTDRSMAMLLGDGAAAAVISAAPASSGGLVAADAACDGTAAALIEIPDGDRYVRMQGSAVFKRATTALVRSVAAALDAAGLDVADVALFVPHQANARIIGAARDALGFTAEQCMVTIDRYGNTSAASIPMALHVARTDGRLRDGDLVVLSGFGAGMTWATVVIRWAEPQAS